ncbi:MAG: helix-turn-helix domain-containing protein, partial [Trebonia sp.]
MNSWAATVETGTRLVHDGELWTVVAMEAGCVVLAGPRGVRKRVVTATLLADATTRMLGTQEIAPSPMGSVLDDLSDAERTQLSERLGHVREVLTGYRSGSADLAEPGEPRPGYDSSLPLMDRYRAKAAELGLGSRTVERWAAVLREVGPVGLVDRRGIRPSDPFAGVDARWVEMCRTVLAEHVDASRPTKQLLLDRVAARLEAEHGPGVVADPGEKKARAVLAELSRGSNAFVGATKQKRSIAARPSGVYGRLRATRPGEYLLLGTTPLDVFAMEPLTLRWVRLELTIALDLF